MVRCHSEVPLHVGIKGKQLPLLIECHVVGIAEPATEVLPVFPIEREAGDPAAWGHAIVSMAAGIRAAWQQLVLRPRAGDEGVLHLGEIRKIAGNHEDGISIRRGDEGVRAVLAAPAEGLDQFGLTILPVLFGHPPDTGGIFPFIDGDPEHALMPQHTVSACQRQIQGLDGGFALGGNRDAVDFPILIGAKQTALAIDGHGDPGTPVGRHPVETLQLEAGEDPIVLAQILRPLLLVCLLRHRGKPRRIAHLGDDDGLRPSRGGGKIQILPVVRRLTADLPGAIRHDVKFLPVLERGAESQDQPGRPVVVAAFHGDDVAAARLEQFEDIIVPRVLPVGRHSEVLTVDKKLVPVVADDGDGSARDFGRQFELTAEEDLFFFAGRRGLPDPSGRRLAGIALGGGHRRGRIFSQARETPRQQDHEEKRGTHEVKKYAALQSPFITNVCALP